MKFKVTLKTGNYVVYKIPDRRARVFSLTAFRPSKGILHTNFNNLYQDLYRILWIIDNTQSFANVRISPKTPFPPPPPPRPQTYAFDNSSPPFVDVFYGRPLNVEYILNKVKCCIECYKYLSFCFYYQFVFIIAAHCARIWPKGRFVRH